MDRGGTVWKTKQIEEKTQRKIGTDERSQKPGFWESVARDEFPRLHIPPPISDSFSN